MNTYEIRMSFLEAFHPTFAVEVKVFFEQNPIFAPYKHLIPITPHPLRYGLNRGELLLPSSPVLLFEYLVFYVCESGVNHVYADKQWDAILPWLRENDYDLLKMCEHPPIKLQPKKIQVYRDLATYLNSQGIHPEEMTLEMCLALEIKGIGVSTKNFLREAFGGDAYKSSIDCVSYTDRNMVGGLRKVYGENASPKKIAATWGDYKNVGNAMCFQVFHYG